MECVWFTPPPPLSPHDSGKDHILPLLKVNPRGATPLFGLYGDVPLDRVWFFGFAVLNRVYNLICLRPKRVKNLS